MFVACGIWCLADVSSVSSSSEQTVHSDEGLTLETSAKHHIPQATNIPYQPLLIKPIFSVLAHAEKQFFSKPVFPCLCMSAVIFGLKSLKHKTPSGCKTTRFRNAGYIPPNISPLKIALQTISPLAYIRKFTPYAS